MSTFREWLAAHPPPESAFEQSLAGVASRVHDGDEFFVAVRELLDEFALRASDAGRARAIADEPRATGDPRHDAYLAALGEHLAAVHALPRPTWTIDSTRFLNAFWFVSEVKGFRALAIAQSPAAFRRRGIFITAGALTRV
jgi:hypothetical protein